MPPSPPPKKEAFVPGHPGAGGLPVLQFTRNKICKVLWRTPSERIGYMARHAVCCDAPIASLMQEPGVRKNSGRWWSGKAAEPLQCRKSQESLGNLWRQSVTPFHGAQKYVYPWQGRPASASLRRDGSLALLADPCLSSFAPRGLLISPRLRLAV